VRHITLLDNGKVSFSNPVRQSLFTYEDCLNGGKPKAVAAADALRRIFPGVVRALPRPRGPYSTATLPLMVGPRPRARATEAQTATGHDMSVPMPGHNVNSVEQTRKDAEFIEALVKEHDVVFLLMDTRESRWLPTMLCTYYNKVRWRAGTAERLKQQSPNIVRPIQGRARRQICINAALGFDTFVVMRHGPHPDAVQGSRLGCYYCNDIVAPTDVRGPCAHQASRHGSNLTRSTGKPWASDGMPVDAGPHAGPAVHRDPAGLVVPGQLAQRGAHGRHSAAPAPVRPPRLRVACWHPALTRARDGAPHEACAAASNAAPADGAVPPTQATEHEIGLLPHTVRGFLTHFANLLVTGQAYSKCTACSAAVLDAYKQRGFDFLLQVFNSPTYLEDVTGLSELHKGTESGLADWDVDDGDEDDF